MKARKGDPRLAVGYLRVSTSEQQNGPEAQRAEIERWCQANGVELAEVFEDRVSGAAELDKRPGLLAAIDILGSRGVGLLVIGKRDRLGRDVVLCAAIERLVARKGAQVVSADNCGNGSTPEAEMLRGIVNVFAQFERALIRARTKAALQVKRERLERTGGVPYGWKVSNDGVHLEADNREQEIVRAARELRGQGLTLRRVGEVLASRGMLPRSGAPTWNPKSVKAVVEAREAA